MLSKVSSMRTYLIPAEYDIFLDVSPTKYRAGSEEEFTENM